MLALLSRLSSHDQGVGWVSSPGPPKGKDLSGSKKMGAAELDGCLWPCSPRRDGSPGSSCSPPQAPALEGLNSRAFLRKCLSWQQLQPTRARLLLTSSPGAVREEKGEERELERRWGLAGGQTMTLLLRWPDFELQLLPGLS